MKVEINHLTKVIQGNVVLDDINACFSCASGENGGRIYGIQGINGSGKTMLMRVICGLVLPTMGTVSIDGEIIGKGISFPRSIGLLLENPIFIDEFTGAKNLSLLCDIKRLVSQAQIGDTLRRVGLNPSDKRPFRKYSLGMKQRLGIAAAIVESTKSDSAIFMRVKIHRKSSFAPSSEALYGVSYRPKLRGQWVPVLRLLAAAALAWVLINALVEAYGVGGCKS